MDSSSTGLWAVLEGRSVPVDTAAFDLSDAIVLHKLTETLLADLPYR